MALRLPRWLGNPVVVLVAAVAFGVFFASPGGKPLARGTALEARTLPTSEGQLPLFGPGVTILNFWGETCPPCRREAPELSRVHQGLGARGRVVGVSIDSPTLQRATAQANALGMQYPIGVLDADLQRTFRVDVVPTTYVIDARGLVRSAFVGAVTEDDLAAAVRGVSRSAAAW